MLQLSKEGSKTMESGIRGRSDFDLKSPTGGSRPGVSQREAINQKENFQMNE